MTDKINPKATIKASQKVAMQMDKGGSNPTGEPASLPAAKELKVDRNPGKSGIVIN